MPAGEGDQLGDDEADHEQEHRGLDVVGAVDLERLVRVGEEEVVGHRRDHGTDRPAPAGPDRGAEDDHQHEHQHDVGAGEVVAERHQDPGHQERTERGDRQSDRSGRVVGGCITRCHTSGIRPRVMNRQGS